jgi:hypothetical protein
MNPKSRQPAKARRRRSLVLLGAGCLVVVAGCGGSGDNTPGATATMTATASVTATATASESTSATMQACADAAALKESADNLDQLDPREVGKIGVQAALQDARTRLEAVKVSSGGQWSSQVSELEAALSALEEAVAGVGGGNLLSQLPTILGRAEQLEQAWTSLEREIDRTCATS